VAFLAGACGKKGPPVAPERRLPAAPAALRGVVDQDSIVLAWTTPRARADGSPLRDLTTLMLHRREEETGAPLKPAILSWGRVVGYEEIASIRLGAPAPATVQGDTVQWVDRRGLQWGRRYVYVVTALDSQGRSSPPSERLPITFLAPPLAPRNLEAAPGDREVTIRWQPPAEFMDGSPVTGEIRYLLLRGVGSEGALSVVTAQPIAATSYRDAGLENDTEYRYAVRSVRLDPQAAATGPASPALTVSPVDVTPPGPPRDLVAIPSAGSVRLAWNPSPDPDVALYAVYRATGTGSLLRVGTTPGVTTVFVDRDVRPGATYRYAVTALDRARKPNESGRSAEVTVRVP
jgi:hypothetical protein